VIEDELDRLEQLARASGLFQQPEMVEFRIGRLACRWRLGEALAKVGRLPVGRPSKIGKGLPISFQAIIDDLKITDPIAIEAQRIACLPAPELEAFCARAREAAEIPT
jgi:hypothetical protein